MTTEHRLRRMVGETGLDIDAGLIRAIAAVMTERGAEDPALCGDAYEMQLAADRTSRRAGGAYYTPQYVVDVVVERTLGPLLDRCTVAQALSLRVLDPSCGGGVFLLGVLRRIERHCIERGEQAAGLRRRIAERCLFGSDIDAQAVAVARLSICLAVGEPCQVTGVVQRDTLRGDDTDQFDAVIGNPPWGQKGFRFSKEQAAYMRGRYLTASGVLDPFKLFVERAHELVRRGGRWGFVLPDIVLLKNQQPVRDLMRTRSKLEWIIDVGRAFEGVNLDAAVIVGERADQVDPDHEVCIWRSLGSDWRDAPPPTVRRAQAVFGELPGHRFNIHADDAALGLVRRLGWLPRLGERVAFHEGVHSGNMRHKLFLSAEPAGGRAARLILGRREVARYRIAWAGRWIDLAAPRQPGDYANLGRSAWHETQKLVVRRTGDRIVAAFDGEGFYFSNNAFVSEFLRDVSIDELHAWVALLNSSFMTWYFRTVQPRTGRLFAELKIEHLRDFPVPPDAPWRAALGQLAGLSRRMQRAVAAEADDPDAARAIDDLVCGLYELGAGDRELVTAAAP